jgi:single-stranded DNA-binding protein
MLYLEGEIDVSEYTDSNGNKRYNTSIIIPRMGIMKMVSTKGDAKQQSSDDLPDDDIPSDIPF